VVLEAAAQNGGALGFASDELQGGREVVLAVAQSADALGTASDELQRDREGRLPRLQLGIEQGKKQSH